MSFAPLLPSFPSFVFSPTSNSCRSLFICFKKKITSAFNACLGRGKHPELAEEAAAKGDAELAGGNNGFVATAAAAPAALPTSSSATA